MMASAKAKTEDTHDAQAAAFDHDRRFARGARGRGGAGAERDARFHRVLLDADDGGREAHPARQAVSSRRPGAAGIAGARRQSRGQFQVADGSAKLPVAYKGILPDLFREGQGVVAEGALDASGVFRADTVLAKHDETYMPKDVADALKKQGHWKDDYGAKPERRGLGRAGAGSVRNDRGSRTLRAGAGARRWR